MRIILVTILALFPLALNTNKAHGAITEISATVGEGQVLQLAAPQGFKIDHVVFASYGLPVNYTINPDCHAIDSLAIIQAAIQNEALIISADNSIFGDPCSGIGKQLSVILAIQDLPVTPPVVEPLTLNDPSGLSVTLDSINKTVILNWVAPVSSNISPERYAIMWRTANTNGWGIATGNVGDSNALNTFITIDVNVVNQAGLDQTYMFQVRADNDTLGVYSNYTAPVEILIPDFARLAAEQAARDAQIAADKAAADALAAAERARIAAALAAQAEADRLAAEKAIADAQAAAALAAAEAKAAEDARILAEQQALAAEAERLKAEEDARIQAEKDAQAALDAAKAEAEALAKAEADALLAAQQAKDEAERIAQELANAKAEADAKAAEEERIAAEKAAKEQAAADAKAEIDAKIAEEKAAQEEKNKALDEAKKAAESGKELTDKEKEAVAEILIEKALESGQAITAAEIQSSGIEYKDLPPETPVEVRTSENGEVLIITAEVAANVALVTDAGALLQAAFTDPGAAIAAIGSIGADMTPGERKEATDMVVATVVAAGAAMNAVGAAASTTGGSTSGGTSGGGSGGGGASGDSKGVRRRKP